MADVPRPHGYATWQEWAERLAFELGDALGGTTAAPVITTEPPEPGGSPTPPPGSPTVVAERGVFSLTGNVANLSYLPDLPTEGVTVTTFHSIGLYWQPASAPLGTLDIPIRYRKLSEVTWRRGLDMWYDRRAVNHYTRGGVEYRGRGSIVHCDPGTEYIIQFGRYNNASDLTDITWLAQNTASTWSETFPEGVVTTLAETISSQYNITVSGSPTAYRVYEANALGTTITVGNTTGVFALNIEASYVIVRGLTLVGGQSGIRILGGSHHIVIEDCEVSNFGRQLAGGVVMDVLNTIRAENWDAGIWVTSNHPLLLQTTNIVVQRCIVRDPAFGSNSWDIDPFTGNVVGGGVHPDGCNGIDLGPSGGNHVIRYNAIYASGNNLGKFYKDCIGSYGDLTSGGFPGPDSDIYMNRLHNAMDDGLQAEGGGVNVRIWKNYLDRVGAALATTVVEIGPTYLWRNVANRLRFYYGTTPDNDARPPMHKAYTYPTGDAGALDGFWGDGRRYVFHHTQMNWPAGTEGSVTRGLGANRGLEGSAGDRESTNNRIYNNVWQLWRDDSGGTYNGIDNSTLVTKQTLGSNNIGTRNTGFFETASFAMTYVTYRTDHGHEAEQGGRYQLAVGSVGHDGGVRLYNFNDDMPSPHQYLGSAPDIGAHEEGSADMVFGPSATGS